MGYLDDIIVFSRSEEEHLQHLEEIFKRLRHFDLKMKREKSSFFKKHIQYLGHLVSEQGFEPLPEKLEAIRNMLHPKTPKEVKQFLGLIGYYQKFIPRFSDLFETSNSVSHDMTQNSTGHHNARNRSTIFESYLWNTPFYAIRTRRKVTQFSWMHLELDGRVY